MLYMLVYVDDIIITGNNPADISWFITSLSTRFSLEYLGDLSFLLGIEILRTQTGLHLTQSRYVSYFLHKENMSNAKPVSTPMESNSALTLFSSTPLSDPTEYRTLVGNLQYLSLTRPDISYSVNKLSQFMYRPTTKHWSALKRILRYLSGTHTQGHTSYY